MTKELVQNIDKFTQLWDKLAISGQPSQPQFAYIKKAGYELVLRVIIEEIELTVTDERQIVLDHGLLYEELTISYNNPSKAAFEQFAHILNKHQDLNIYVHCTAGYCTSGLFIPYLMIYKNYTKQAAMNTLIMNQFTDTWNTFIDEIVADYSDYKE